MGEGGGGGVSDDGRGLQLLDLGLLDLDLLGEGGGVVEEWGSHRGVGVDHWSHLADGVDETVLVVVLGESLQADGPEATLGGNQVTVGGVNWAGGVGGGGSQGSGGKGGDGNELLHLEIGFFVWIE